MLFLLLKDEINQMLMLILCNSPLKFHEVNFFRHFYRCNLAIWQRHRSFLAQPQLKLKLVCAAILIYSSNQLASQLLKKVQTRKKSASLSKEKFFGNLSRQSLTPNRTPIIAQQALIGLSQALSSTQSDLCPDQPPLIVSLLCRFDARNLCCQLSRSPS